MLNNKILKSLRYTFDFSDRKMIDLFASVQLKVSREDVCNWLKKDDDPDYLACPDEVLLMFLDAYILECRGPSNDHKPQTSSAIKISNNLILRKLKIALNLKTTDIIDILDLADFKISKHELSSFFRSPDHRHYRQCKDQILRSFLKGLQIKFRPQS